MQNARTLWNKTKDLARGKPIIQGDTMEEVWALKDVSFEIRRGEAVGIIGRNGAGKSTLLKILSRITEPSTGRVTIKGRVASLLEVGTGFHPELTGRENIYLNGTILGMARAEIKRKFDEIVAFAEMEKYLDTPVKRYSSGMYVRLAFAVAAHLEPEILVVDEVLAVGDAEFQRKCIGKMSAVARGGRTVLFVSHNMAAVTNLCKNCILLQKGAFLVKDETRLVIQEYLRHAQHEILQGVLDLKHHPNRSGTGVPCLKSISISGYPDGPLVCGQPAVVRVGFNPELISGRPEIGFTVESIMGQRIFTFTTYWQTKTPDGYENRGEIACYIQRLNLAPGVYSLNVAAGPTNNPLQDNILGVCQFEVAADDYYGSGKLPSSNHGVVFLDAEWIS